jgi:ketosteroid isomerase-like protein
MKAVVLSAALVLLVANPNPAIAQDTATEREVAQIFHVLNNASIKKDRTTIERLLADDYLYIHSNGSAKNRAEEIAETMSPDMGWTNSQIGELRVRVFGDVAIVTGTNTLTGAAKGYASGVRRFTDVWVRFNGLWKTVGGQSTVAPR